MLDTITSHPWETVYLLCLIGIFILMFTWEKKE